ncbi:hypothetical protein SORBI_3006G268700 [Sorghum bicolor]|uniref:DUF4220 domain-containing protein n=1 Tax=Sorghum bicolor TaxID=4558 RepID=A0A1B6PNV5_SORBI|nr:hypothetical protein SORBI_3006G268700 [Sorghum bicolor]
MELVFQQNGVLVNKTRAAEALSELLNHSRRTIIQVEALVTVAAALLFLQLILATWKRRWHNPIVSFVLALCNASLLPLVFYTLSIMQSSPVKNSMYTVWGASLLMAAGGTIAVSEFDYDDKKKLMQLITGFARYVFYFAMLLTLLEPYSQKESWTRQLQLFGKRHWSASSRCISGLLMVLYFTRVVSVSLSIRVKLSMKNDHQKDTDHETTEGDKYQVGYAITIDQICSNSDYGETLENVCLSLALCQFCLRRYKGLSSAQESLPTTHHLVFNRLLQTEEHYERAFKIIEVELGFCYDFYFTKYHDIYFGMVVCFPLFLCRVIFLTLVLVYTVQGSVTIETPDPIVQVQITRADNIITLVLLGTALVVELLEALVYLASDWIKVSLACQYVKHKPNAFLEKLIGFFSRVTIFSPQRNRIAQYTVILPDKFFVKFFPKCNLDPLEISPETKKAIAGSIKPTFGEQTNRLASQARNSMFEHWALKDHWTLKDHSQVEIMLIWHIATDYCYVSPSRGNGSNPEREVAVTLSRYCAYLLAFVPQLIPYHEADIKELIGTLKKEIAKNLPSSGVPSERYQTMKELGDDPCPRTVFKKGVKLGKQLEDMPDEAQRWKAMADFWAKTIIYIAPSHITAKEHMRQLENGGEFLTHIWALLSHARILNLVRDDDEVAKPAQDQPTQETV